MKRSALVLILLISGVCLFSQIATKILFEDGWKIFGEETIVEKPSLPLTMIVYGDSRWGNQTHRKLVELMDEYRPAIVVHLGDMVNSGDNEREWEIFFEITAPLRSYAFFQPVKGNHEKPDVYYRQHFGLYNYWAKVEDYVFIFLDPDTGVKRCENFIRSIDLSGKIPIVFLHYPIFSGGPHGRTQTVKNLQVLHDVFRELNVPIVFSSHDHNYQRIVKDGITYIVTGGGGAPLYRLDPIEGLLVGAVVHHFVKVNLHRDRIECEAISVNGEIIDSFTVSVRSSS
ncbi:MAG: metallophosphoesterase family protein [Thermotoga caldifontis]|uniref:metallophosphoesterase family protein n=1 Tax=Thermotoga caldifontis TaxID=1508419 RepID=UPI003C7EBE02